MINENQKKDGQDAIVCFLIAAMVLLIPTGMNNSFAQHIPDEGLDAPYTIEEIEHSFAIMEHYVIYDKNKNITFDVINATLDNVAQEDIDLASDFAIHNNQIMNTAIGSTGQVNEFQTKDKQLKRAIIELTEGKFQALFEERGSVGNVGEIIFTTYSYDSIPITSAFEISETQIEQIQHGSGSNSLLACGGSMSNPHPWFVSEIYPDREDDPFDGYQSAIEWLYANDYHRVLRYATDHYQKDYARTDTSAPSDCNSGQFRVQAVMVVKTTGVKFNTQHDEPNPELLSYIWPKLWWGSYTYWWHQTDGGTHS